MSIDLPANVVCLRTSLQRVLIYASEIRESAEKAKWELERSGRPQASELPGRTPGDPQWASYGDVSRRMPLIVDINDDDPNAEAIRASNKQEQREYESWRNREDTYGWPSILDRLQKSAIEFWNHWQSANDALSALPQKTHDILDQSTGGPWMVMVRRTLNDVEDWPKSSRPHVCSDGTFPVEVQGLVTKVEKDGLPDWNNAFTSLRGYDDDLRALDGYGTDGGKKKAAKRRTGARGKSGPKVSDENKRIAIERIWEQDYAAHCASCDPPKSPHWDDDLVAFIDDGTEIDGSDLLVGLTAKELKTLYDRRKDNLRDAKRKSK